jgi:hypothetical protein
MSRTVVSALGLWCRKVAEGAGLGVRMCVLPGLGCEGARLCEQARHRTLHHWHIQPWFGLAASACSRSWAAVESGTCGTVYASSMPQGAYGNDAYSLLQYAFGWRRTCALDRAVEECVDIQGRQALAPKDDDRASTKDMKKAMRCKVCALESPVRYRYVDCDLPEGLGRDSVVPLWVGGPACVHHGRIFFVRV